MRGYTASGTAKNELLTISPWPLNIGRLMKKAAIGDRRSYRRHQAAQLFVSKGIVGDPSDIQRKSGVGDGERRAEGRKDWGANLVGGQMG